MNNQQRHSSDKVALTASESAPAIIFLSWITFTWDETSWLEDENDIFIWITCPFRLKTDFKQPNRAPHRTATQFLFISPLHLFSDLFFLYLTFHRFTVGIRKPTLWQFLLWGFLEPSSAFLFPISPIQAVPMWNSLLVTSLSLSRSLWGGPPWLLSQCAVGAISQQHPEHSYTLTITYCHLTSCEELEHEP